jgi:hypothetical protein
MKTHNRTGGWLSGQTKPYPPFDDSDERRAGIGATSFLSRASPKS